jgi:hypothetical protein
LKVAATVPVYVFVAAALAVRWAKVAATVPE